MASQAPNRLCIDPASPHFDENVLKSGVRVKINGVERFDVEEYDMAEGWARIAVNSKTRDRRGRPMTLKISGEIEAWIDDAAG